MINIVTWLDNNKYQDELSMTCAKNGIRIIADTFENSQDFLKKFDEIDTTIDVLVLGNGNLEGIDKNGFFEDVCVTEPNLRIIIVFPGYRNQYVEKQIAEYRALGIHDVIYEGQRLDEKSLANVIVGGYIYGYEVNTFDDLKEAVKPLSITPKCITIGVMGLTHGCGTTHMVINIANYISHSENFSVKAVDLSGTGSLRFAKGKKVSYIVHSNIDEDRLKKSSRVIIYDLGTPFNISSKGKLLGNNECYRNENIEIFKACDLKICMCYADSWHIGKLKYLLNDKEWRRSIDKSYVFLLDSIPDKQSKSHSRINIYARGDRMVLSHIEGLFKEKGA